MTSTIPTATRFDLTLIADPRRVVIKLFVPGEDAALATTNQSRASGMIERITRLSEHEVNLLLDDTLKRFTGRHHDILSTFQHHYELVAHRVPPDVELSPTARTLIGAYFSHEFSVEAAALCNPSMVEHPDQSDLEPGQLRVAISLRQIGEGHISSIGFIGAVLGPGNQMLLDDRSGPLMIGQRTGARHERDHLAAGLAEEEMDNELAATVLNALPERFDDADVEDVLTHLPAELLSRHHAQETLEHIRRIIATDYAVTFPATVPLHQRVLWPAAPAESKGMEDARFVRVVEEDGRTAYRATYTAYDGRAIGGRMLYTRDLRHFEVTALRGPAARNKGMALFPRPVNGRHLALCRSDGETSGLTVRGDHQIWQEPVPLHVPRRGWELMQVGNCGSPIETDAGWLVLTHGVGPMRRYAIGAMLLDLDNPEKVIGELPQGLIDPDEHEREGYVPNVVYSCGGLVHDDRLWVPYGASDARVGFATIGLRDVLDSMVPTD
ncbi:glycoside hydrolase family 130 protein [Spirilliplanes yamanashiensis]|uniref:Glycosidase n=1 Tax=Spirilliplanes yamanashiensis TaxID=42233 RepID=A0A8J4DHA0_9ACTN|nr:glycoside hydrolase family 130 protein [Spirilliplanes yamanashiensis]MDP9819230.1 putative GH43/DUF377 family glycosyl hydrolase [Spirilliplanes yamanashiensis]GIJ01947.1 glycosidase [Spirilliplanes yamanashiensis]